MRAPRVAALERGESMAGKGTSLVVRRAERVRAARLLGLALAVLAIWLGTASAASAYVTIQFDYTYDTSGFFAANPDAKKALQAAGATISRLSDTLEAITPTISNTWMAQFSRPDTGADTTTTTLAVPQNTLIVYVGARALSGNTLGLGGPGGYVSASGSGAWYDTLFARGQMGAFDDLPTDTGPWGGSIAFNSNPNLWYFGLSGRGVPANRSDFYSVAVHELAHVLGFGAASPYPEDYLTSWDTYASGATFTGPQAAALYGGNVPLDDTGHWAAGVRSIVYGLAQDAAMTPSLTVGQRKRFTDLDWAGMTDLGWQHATSAVTWGGGTDAHWDADANWTGGPAATLGLVATFDTATSHPPTLYQHEYADGVAFKTADWTLGGAANTLTVGPAGVSSTGSGTNRIQPKVEADPDDSRSGAVTGNVWKVTVVDAANTLVFDGGFDGGNKTLVKDGAGEWAINGAQSYAAGAMLDVEAGTVTFGSDAGSGGTGLLSIDVVGGLVNFDADQHLDTLIIGSGGKVVLRLAHLVVLKDLQMGGVDLGAMTLTPEPATLGLVAFGVVAMAMRRRGRARCR